MSDNNETPAPEATEGNQQATKEITIRIPAHIPDNIALNAFQLGLGVINRLSAGMLVAMFPITVKRDGKEHPAIGRQEVQLLKPNDLTIVKEVFNAIHLMNQKVLASPPLEVLSSTLETDQAKGELLRQAKQAISGETPIVSAKEAPRKPLISIHR